MPATDPEITPGEAARDSAQRAREVREVLDFHEIDMADCILAFGLGHLVSDVAEHRQYLLDLGGLSWGNDANSGLAVGNLVESAGNLINELKED